VKQFIHSFHNGISTNKTKTSERFVMHMRIVGFGAAVLMMCLCSFCQKQDKKDVIATIDNSVITKESYNAFWEMKRLYPSYTGDYFPGERSLSTFLIGTCVISDDGTAKSLANKIKSSPDWEWKQRYFPAQMYLMKVLDANMGFTDKELEGYYKAHSDEFKTTVPQVAPAAVKDTAKKAAVAQSAKKDTVIQKQFV
jgi:hypothetical protein